MHVLCVRTDIIRAPSRQKTHLCCRFGTFLPPPLLLANIEHSFADRGAYICQSQSMNLFAESPDYGRLTSMHFYA